MTFNIDKYAYLSKLKNKDPMLKLLFALLTLGICLWAKSWVIAMSVIIIMGWITVLRGGIPFLFYLKLMLIPVSFLVIGVLAIALTISEQPELFVLSLPAAGFRIGFTASGFLKAANQFLISLGSVSCLYFLSLNTPMLDILTALHKLKVPKLLVELMGLIYRFIFILLETSQSIYTAQNSRLGYTTLSTGFRSLGKLSSVLLIRSFKRADDLYTALEARGYHGELNVLNEPVERNRNDYIAPCFLIVFLFLSSLLLKF